MDTSFAAPSVVRDLIDGQSGSRTTESERVEMTDRAQVETHALEKDIFYVTATIVTGDTAVGVEGQGTKRKDRHLD